MKKALLLSILLIASNTYAEELTMVSKSTVTNPDQSVTFINPVIQVGNNHYPVDVSVIFREEWSNKNSYFQKHSLICQALGKEQYMMHSTGEVSGAVARLGLVRGEFKILDRKNNTAVSSVTCFNASEYKNIGHGSIVKNTDGSVSIIEPHVVRGATEVALEGQFRKNDTPWSDRYLAGVCKLFGYNRYLSSEINLVRYPYVNVVPPTTLVSNSGGIINLEEDLIPLNDLTHKGEVLPLIKSDPYDSITIKSIDCD